jgi:ATP-dependent RNA helicase DeaD
MSETENIQPENLPLFSELGLSEAVLQAVTDSGYETPSPIQVESIPFLLQGRDLLGQAQTGTGKTAAFALPLLSRINFEGKDTKIMVLAPTRELAIQVAEAFQSYAKHLNGVNVLPLYGGQSYDTQLRQLRRGAQIVVGTPGRVMDHMRRKTLNLENLQALVLDEADEMLRMGFIDDVEWVLEQTPQDRQIALFSATMPSVIRRVADSHLTNPKHIKIESKTTTATTIRQRYLQVPANQKLDAMTRLLEVEEFDGMIVFVRTKTATVELAEKLSARGFACEALNGDIPQNQRERVVDRLKRGKLDILIATDVVARGLDVERISHVLNFDVPYDTESYVHRIGRTGRAGRTGDAILFINHRERRMLSAIERATRQTIEPMQVPTADDVNTQRVGKFKQRITDTLSSDDLSLFEGLVNEYEQEFAVDPLRLAAALAKLVQGKEPLFLKELPPQRERAERSSRERSDRPERGDRGDRPDRGPRKPRVHSTQAEALKGHPDVKTIRYQLDVGRNQGVKPGNIVGAIANEADLDSAYIGNIDIFDDFTTVDLPDGMPNDVLSKLRNTRVCNQPINLTKATEATPPTPGKRAPQRGRSEGGRGEGRRNDSRRDGDRSKGRNRD